MDPVKQLERAAGTAAHAIRHPLAATAYAAGVVRGLAQAGMRTLAGHDPADTPTGAASGPASAPHVPAQRLEPAPLGESFTTEPKATSRASEHGRAGDDAEIDAWAAEADDVDVETPVGTTGAGAGYNPDTAEADLQQPGTEPLLDPGTAKAIRSESARMQKAADPDKG
ncbi:MAG TPA: hypothetical protein VFE07_11590 [Marmoricola sp.]|jgi:hypothetical protein|nr:hypothetical protein [Marmoricola sp.]